MASSHFIQELFWIAYSLLLGAVAVISVICFRKDRSIPTLVMLLSGIVWAILIVAIRVGYLIGNRMRWFHEPGSNVAEIFQYAGFGASVCLLVFHVGLLVFALRWRRKADRIAELEAIIQDLQQENDRVGTGVRQ